MATTINASTSAGLVSTADTSGVLQLQAANTTVLNAELGKALALQGASSTTGCGIAFPATQVASSDVNTLDDYEEGSWTPSLGGTTTYTAQRGTYTKIGRLVCVTGVIVVSAIGTGSASVVSGLPFTAKAQDSGGLQVTYFNGAATSLVFATGYTDDGATTFRFYSLTAAAATTGANAIFGTGTSVNFSGTYLTT